MSRNESEDDPGADFDESGIGVEQLSSRRSDAVVVRGKKVLRRDEVNLNSTGQAVFGDPYISYREDFPQEPISQSEPTMRSSFHRSIPKDRKLLRMSSLYRSVGDASPHVIRTKHKIHDSEGATKKEVKVKVHRASSADFPLPERLTRPKSESNDIANEESLHYRITSKEKKIKGLTTLQQLIIFVCCQKHTGSSHEVVSAFGDRSSVQMIGLHSFILRSLVFSYKTTFPKLFFCLLFVYFLLIIIFSFLIWGVGEIKETCIQPTFGANGAHFFDAFSLSWSTFSTVGYGHTHPQTSDNERDQNTCFIITVLCTLEAFVGILWTGMAGAIIFNKVVRLRSLAAVLFSDPITIRYGSGLEAEDDENWSEGKIECPILSFRIANLNFDEIGGEIIDAGLKLEVISDATIPPIDAQKEVAMKRNIHLIQQGRICVKPPKKRSSQSFRHYSSRRCLHTLAIDTPENPYFKRTWVVQHTLNENSPLLDPHVRNSIKSNAGYWPTSFNHYEDIRRSLKFDRIFVSLVGTSVLSASTVYAQHMYDVFDVNIGYDFVPVLYKGVHGNIMIDFDVFNDVVEQYGGGGEPFSDESEGRDSTKEESESV